MEAEIIAINNDISYIDFIGFLRQNNLWYKMGAYDYEVSDDLVDEYVKIFKNGYDNNELTDVVKKINVSEFTQRYNIDYEEFLFFLNEEGFDYIDVGRSNCAIRSDKADKYVRLFNERTDIKEKMQILKQKEEQGQIELQDEEEQKQRYLQKMEEQRQQELKKAEELKQLKIRKAEARRKAEEKKQLDIKTAMINRLAEHGLNGYFEYQVISLLDERGVLNAEKLQTILNSLGKEGWHVVGSYANEIGHNTKSGGIAGFSTGTNTTIDQNVIILERFVLFQ